MANTLFEAIKETDNSTLTTNGMSAHKSTLSKVLDLFYQGASHRSTPEDVTNLVMESYLQDKLNTLRCLFYLRDVRGGQGEREVFRKGIRKIAKLDTETFIKSNIIRHIPEYGRWDDLFCLFGVSEKLDKQIYKFIEKQLSKDVNALGEEKTPVSLLAKWLPSCNTSSPKTRKLAKKLCKAFGLTEREYRKTLSKLRERIGVLETYLSEKNYTFDYSSVPSNANLKYRKCFLRNDGVRYNEHIVDVEESLKNGDNLAHDNVSTLYPYEIVNKCHMGDYKYNETEQRQLNNMWKQLPNYFGNAANKNWLAVIDTSGSMYCPTKPTPIDVAISLGLYIGEHNTGIFKNKYITFSSRPVIMEFDDKWPLSEKVDYIARHVIVENTDLIAVYELILSAAKNHNTPVEEMPEAIVMISDMQFDCCVYYGNNPTAYKKIRNLYEEAGYPVPKLVFWNVAQYNTGNVPVTMHQHGATLVGGCKPGMFEQILGGLTPLDFVNQILGSERYSQIVLREV